MKDLPYKLSLDLRVLDHLGIKLYSNAAAVLSEAVANGWDADADLIQVNIGQSQITIADDGVGMNLKQINDRFLNVGYDKLGTEGDVSAKGRVFMGRKGIGKLALFSIADKIEIHTRRGKEQHAFKMETDKVKAAIEAGLDYYPVPIPFAEHLSRTVWAPARAGANRETKWFYERARGQYSDEKGRRRSSAARLRTFEAEYPSNQWFTKTDLAKFGNTWDGLPHMVSRGAQKNFAEFTLQLQKGLVPDIAYFQELVAKAIIFRAAERIVSSQDFGGYRANIVTYTLAWIAHHSGGGVDLGMIWTEQGINDQMTDLITAACPAIHKLIVDSGGANVTEWCKQEACWIRIRGNNLGLPDRWNRILQQWRDSAAASGKESGATIERVIALGGNAWLALARWGKETRQLEDAHRSVASMLARTINSSRRPSERQATEGEKILAAAKLKGFKIP